MAIPEFQIEPRAKQKLEPRKRKGYNICDPKWARKEFRYLLKSKPKKAQEEFVSALISSCATGAAKGAVIGAKMPKEIIGKKKRPINSWQCYLKVCHAEDNDLKFQDCLVDKARAQRLYYPKKEEWKELAAQNCPI